MAHYEPLKEMVIGVVFEPVQGFKAAHYGLFWKRIRKKFPICQDAPSLPPIGKEGTMSIHFKQTSLPRVWYINQDEDRLLQLQGDRLLVNWRKKESSSNYIGYEKCLEWFFEDWKIFQKWLAAEKLEQVRIKQLELNYTNQIPYEKMEGGLDNFGSIFPVLKFSDWPSSNGLLLPENFACQFKMVSPDIPDSTMLINMATAVRLDDQKPFIQIAFHVTVPVSDVESDVSKSRFDKAHDWIVNAFKGLVSKSAREKLWS
ncbi:MAG: TIGR04255 family protein [Magnetococcales bacterium]|nr:TIGR04255 family protein [Magnetococcales bacterium]